MQIYIFTDTDKKAKLEQTKFLIFLDILYISEFTIIFVHFFHIYTWHTFVNIYIRNLCFFKPKLLTKAKEPYNKNILEFRIDHTTKIVKIQEINIIDIILQTIVRSEQNDADLVHLVDPSFGPSVYCSCSRLSIFKVIHSNK